MRRACAITLTDEDRPTLERWSRSRSTEARLVERSRIVLLAAEGRENKDIAVELGITRATVGRWRDRFADRRIAGIEKDAPRGGKREQRVGLLRQSHGPAGGGRKTDSMGSRKS